MKKIAAVLMALVMIMGLTACGGNSPVKVTEGFLSAVKDQDKGALQAYLENPDINILANNAGHEEELNTIFDSITKNLTWEITSVKENEEKTEATVTVKISNADFSGVLATYQTEAVNFTKEKINDESFTKEEMADKCIKIFTQHVKAAAKADTEKEQTVEVTCVKDENKEWKLQLTDEMVLAVMGGLDFPQ